MSVINCNVNEFVYKHKVKYKEDVGRPNETIGEFTIEELPKALVSLCYEKNTFNVHLIGWQGQKVKEEMKIIEGSRFGRNQIEVKVHE